MASPSRSAGAASVPATHSAHVNVGSAERVASAVGGGLLALYGLTRGSLGGALLATVGGVLAYRGVSGHCPAFQALGVSTAEAEPRPVEVETAVTVNRPRPEVYEFWQRLENLPSFMHHLRRVDRLDGNRSHWVAKGAGPLPDIEWDAETTQFRQNEVIAWRSLPGADVDNAGHVRFEDGPNGGTEVHVRIGYRPPAGAAGASVAGWFSPLLEQIVKEDVRRFKHVLEAGEVPTIDGQPTGT